MKLVNLTTKEFKEYADNNPQITFHQTKEWANLKKVNGWKSYYIGLKENNEIKGAALLLSKQIPFIKKYMFYSPRGFLIDYNNKDLLKEFTLLLKEYIKKEKGIFVKIDPYVEYQERDNDGNIKYKDGQPKINSKLFNNNYSFTDYSKGYLAAIFESVGIPDDNLNLI